MRGFTFTSVIVLVIVVAVVGVAAVLLARTVQEAQAINAKAQNIATNGRGINEATDSVIQLNRTNDLAESILDSARPLDTQLSRIVATATGIDNRAASINAKAGSINSTAGSINDSAGTINTSAGEINSAAGSINSSAGAINSTAGAINSSAGSINTSAGAINTSAGAINTSAGRINDTAVGIDSLAGSILGTAREIDTDVRLINQNLDVTLELARAVKGDTGDILGQAGDANQTAACISRKVEGQSGNDGDCEGQSQRQAPQPSREVSGTRLSRKAFEGLLDEAPQVEDKAAAPAPANTPRRRTAIPPLPTDQLTERVIERLPETPTPRQLNDIVNELVPGLLGPGRDPNKPPPPDVLQRLLPELPLLGR
jgi:type II secretory pathway pseudopilin PulG